MLSRCIALGDQVPCGVCSTGRQWQCAGEELAAGGAAGHIAVVEEAAGGMDLVEEEHASTHWDLGDGRAGGAGADIEDVEPCRVVALGAVEEEAWCSSGLTSNVSKLSPRRRDDVGTTSADLQGSRNRQERTSEHKSDLHGEAAHKSHSQAAAR